MPWISHASPAAYLLDYFLLRSITIVIVETISNDLDILSLSSTAALHTHCALAEDQYLDHNFANSSSHDVRDARRHSWREA